MIKAIIFDCFGVLIGNIYTERINNLELTSPDTAQQVRAINRAADVGILSEHDTHSRVSDLLEISPEQLRSEQNLGEVRNEGLIEQIIELKKSYKLAMLSNVSSRSRVEIRFNEGQLDSLFDAVVASGDVGYIKPHPEIYKIAAARLGVAPEECLMVDDILEFCEGARQVGMQAIQFKTTTQFLADFNSLIDRGGKRE